MSKIKLLFDVEQLCTDGLKGTGIVRVSDVLLQKLLQNKELDIYPIITSKRGDFIEYLKQRQLYEQLKDKIVFMPNLKSTTKNQWWYQSLRTKFLTSLYLCKYKSVLRQFDAYLSLFSPISPVIYGSGLKTFMVIHDLIPIYYPNGCDKKFVSKFTDWIKRSHPNAYFCVSDYTAKDLHRFKPESAETPFYKMYLGAEERFKPIENKEEIISAKEKYGIKTPKYFLAVSEITERKNLPHLLRAFASFLKDSEAKDISLVLVGPVRKGYEEVLKQVKGLTDYQDKILQTGFVANEDLTALYCGATAFIYPSLYEGFGLPVLEAMQCGTPVITCNNTSLPEVGGDAVLYINGKDDNQTAQMLYKIYTDKDLAESLRNRGLNRAKEFDWQKTADVVINAVKNEIKGEKHE